MKLRGPLKIVEQLHAKGYRLVGLSNWSAEKFKLTRERYDLFKLFDDIIISGEVKTMKPDRAIFDIALRKIGLRAEECLFIDDSPNNVEAAAALGFQIIHFQNSRQLEDELRRLCVL